MKSIPGLIELVKTLRTDGLTIVLIEHNMKVISELADEAIFMNRGARMVSGTPREVATDPAVVELYLGDAADGH
jgi:branched-chain amino acid transport system ATP-binding protein